VEHDRSLLTRRERERRERFGLDAAVAQNAAANFGYPIQAVVLAGNGNDRYPLGPLVPDAEGDVQGAALHVRDNPCGQASRFVDVLVR
jgi:hypothetical protein